MRWCFIQIKGTIIDRALFYYSRVGVCVCVVCRFQTAFYHVPSIDAPSKWLPHKWHAHNSRCSAQVAIVGETHYL